MDGFDRLRSYLGDAAEWLSQPEAYGVGLLCLAIVFAWSGVAKLRRPARAAVALVDFGLLRRATPGVGIGAGTAEAVLAAFLVAATIMPSLTVVAAALAAVLLWGFTVLLARSLRRGESFACFCFGDSSTALSRGDLIRTGLLATLATALAVAAPASNEAVQASDFVLQVAVALAIAGTTILVWATPNLVRWNRDPFGLADARWVRRES